MRGKPYLHHLRPPVANMQDVPLFAGLGKKCPTAPKNLLRAPFLPILHHHIKLRPTRRHLQNLAESPPTRLTRYLRICLKCVPSVSFDHIDGQTSILGPYELHTNEWRSPGKPHLVPFDFLQRELVVMQGAVRHTLVPQ